LRGGYSQNGKCLGLKMERNNLYPIFLKAKNLNILIVGGGNVAEEKLKFLLKSSPDANVELVALKFTQAIKILIKKYKVELTSDRYHLDYLDDKHIVIVATNSKETNIKIYNDCKKRNLLVNVADNPEYCDFYLGGIVTKGNVKIAISTNGKSPTMAKRLRQFFEEVLPEDLNELVENLNSYRKKLKGDFSSKVDKLNKLTKSLVNKV
jgi:precorrin-2 dehydrogenase/sirohydrochlorin ferrochelatase